MSTENIYLKDQDYDKQRALWPFMKRIFTYALRHKGLFGQLILFTLLGAVVDTLFPVLWLHFIDDFIRPSLDLLKAGQAEQVSWNSFWFYFAMYMLLSISYSLFISIFMLATGKIREWVIYDLRKDMFDKLQYLSHSFFNRVASGWITIRLTSDVDKVAEVISWGFISLVYGLVMITTSLTVMFYYHVPLTLVVIAVVPILQFIAIRIRLLLLGHARKARKLYSEMAADLTEHINGIEVNKATVQEVNAAHSFRGITGNLKESSYKAGYYTSMYQPVVLVIGSIAAAAVIYTGGHLVVEENLGVTVGLLAAFFSYAIMIFEPIFDITYYYATAQDSLSAGERIFSLIDEPIEIKDEADATDYGTLRGQISFEGVRFA
ncbi:MAG: ABC transporter transmembrane domain-containing protein, partial [Bacteroidota bacterium]